MGNKSLGVTLGLFLLVSGFFLITGSNFENETSSKSPVTILNSTELKSNNKLSTESLFTSSSNELIKENNDTDTNVLKEFVLPKECSSSYKV